MKRRPLLASILAPIAIFSILCSQIGIASADMTNGSNGAGNPEAGTTLYYHRNFVDSTALVTDENGNQVAELAYLPFGGLNKGMSSGLDNFRSKFGGHELDSGSKLYSFGQRYYDPDLGQFTRPDPARQYFSPYIYGNDDPEDFMDPNGEWSWTVFDIVV